MTIAIYSRKSKFTGRGESIANQVELCRQRTREYIAIKNVPETGVKILIYEDEGFSGKNTARPEFQRMLAAVRAGEIDCVVCYKLDRISRNVGDFAHTYETFERHGADFLCAGETYDTTTPAGRAMMGMVSVFAQMEREVTAERIRDNMHMLARSGRWLGGHTPTGFRSTKDDRVDVEGKIRAAFKLTPVKDEMDLVAFIYSKFTELKSIAGTARYLLLHDIRTKNGNNFTSVAVREILRNPVYCIAGQEAGDYFREKGADICFSDNELDNRRGFMPYNRTSSKKERQQRNDIGNWLVALGRHDGIIPPDTWVKIQRILDAKQVKDKSAVRTPHKSQALLSGLLICKRCNSAMRPHVHTSRKTKDGAAPYYYICELKERSAKARCAMDNAGGALIDRAILDELAGYEREDSSVHRSLRELRRRISDKNDPADDAPGFLASELASKLKQIDRLLDALGDGGQDAFADLTRRRINALAAQCAHLQNEIDKAALTNTPNNHDIRTVAAALKVLKDTMHTANAAEKRELIRSTVSRILWDGEQAHIYLIGD